MAGFNGLAPKTAIEWVRDYNATVRDPTTRRHIRAHLEGWLAEFNSVVASVPAALQDEYKGLWAQDEMQVRACIADMLAVDAVLAVTLGGKSCST